MNKDGGAAFPVCSMCGNAVHIKQGHQWLCQKHYRFQQMRITAKRHDKLVPEYESLELLWIACRGKCMACGKEMNLLSANGKASVVTLQHNRDGSIALLCLSCNSRHGSFVGDSFYDSDKSKRICPCCGHELKVSDFYADNNGGRFGKTTAYCKKCQDLKHEAWINKNREAFNEKRRRYYCNRKDARKEIQS